MIIGYFIVQAEPAVFVLTRQVEEMTSGAISAKAMGACEAVGGNIITDAFGIVAMVVMTPLITIQIMGVIFKIKENKLHKNIAAQLPRTSLDDYDDMEIIELYRENDLNVMFISLGAGTAVSEVLDYLGLDSTEKAGAYGGTVIHAKGTGMEAAEKFMNVSLAVEKEIIYIVTKSEQKNTIMSAIMKNAGPDTKAKAITFSLPVTDTAGLRLIED